MQLSRSQIKYVSVGRHVAQELAHRSTKADDTRGYDIYVACFFAEKRSSIGGLQVYGGGSQEVFS